MRECVVCGSTKNVGEVITVSPYGTFSKRYNVCLKHIRKIEDYLEKRAKIIPKKNQLLINPNSGISTITEFLDSHSDDQKV